MGGTGISRYREVRATLEREIAAGDFPVGERFPTDLELCARFGVSRHTVREAVRELQGQGVLARTRGFGTVVRARPAEVYRQTIAGLAELESDADEASFACMSDAVIVVHAGLADLLGCDAGQRWLRFSGVRAVQGREPPLSWSEIFISPEFIHARDRLREGVGPSYETLRLAAGVEVGEVEQQITAVAMPADIAPMLGCEAGSPALVVRRRYFSRGAREPFEISLGMYPADRYAYTARLTREAPAGAGLGD